MRTGQRKGPFQAAPCGGLGVPLGEDVHVRYRGLPPTGSSDSTHGMHRCGQSPDKFVEHGDRLGETEAQELGGAKCRPRHCD